MTESLIGFAILLALILLRVPIAFAMSAVGGIGFALMRGWEPAWAMTGQVAFDTALSYSLSVIPLFIFMGNILAGSGVAQGLFAGANRLFGRMRGGLAMASVFSCGGFSAVCGSSLATAATMSKVAMPSMRRFGYDDKLATGSIAAGGTLGILIPPSVILIIYGLLTETNIAKLFIAGIIPGIIGVALYLGAVMVAVRLNPALAPKQADPEPLSRSDMIGLFSVLGLFLFIMVGIYGGFFTPTEAAGMGAGASVVIAAVLRTMSWREFFDATMDSVRATAMIFAIIIGAELFTNFINFAGLPDALAGFVVDNELPVWAVIAFIIVVYMLLGCVLESLSMILLTVPVFYPLMFELQFANELLLDPENALIWFAIVVVVATEISLITPPVGMNVFVLKGVLKDVSLGTIFKGVFPFWVADILRLTLLILVPSLSLWLVGAM
ncbi:TRAP transporter large permease [Litoreibacter arenae]|uniref:TRAP transporter large permease protein n=1 Tax=Litoreibacter arenae DSM 19593 TaxID=1123360 RepID=S9QA14_9RHOB|nr:TRAP transporter large permease [Litoreibacter arenae]EPX78201.1 TRAP dicarboxylate transporter, DctM subunit, unknown substrate 3 [Litoreibacter arenae DSM 19593]